MNSVISVEKGIREILAKNLIDGTPLSFVDRYTLAKLLEEDTKPIDKKDNPIQPKTRYEKRDWDAIEKRCYEFIKPTTKQVSIYKVCRKLGLTPSGNSYDKIKTMVLKINPNIRIGGKTLKSSSSPSYIKERTPLGRHRNNLHYAWRSKRVRYYIDACHLSPQEALMATNADAHNWKRDDQIHLQSKLTSPLMPTGVKTIFPNIIDSESEPYLIDMLRSLIAGGRPLSYQDVGVTLGINSVESFGLFLSKLLMRSNQIKDYFNDHSDHNFVVMGDVLYWK